ncbi:MAG TPA: efflux RND transporter periplasmic adaptor subunit [Candidatus Methylacidiphilales bacterium]
MSQSPAQAEASPKPTTVPEKAKSRRWIGWAVALGIVIAVTWVVVALAPWRDRSILTIYGNVDIRDVTLGFRVPGRIAQVLKDEGDRVTQGELIARLDPATYQHAVAERAADVEVKLAALKNAELALARNQALINYGGTSKEQYDDAVSSHDQAAANLDLSKAQLSSAQTDLDDTEIHAPADGVVITRSQEPGAIVQSGNVVLTVSLDRPIWVRAYIPEPNLGNVSPGQETEIFTDTQPNHPYHGKIGYVSPEAEFTPKSVETTQLRTSLVYRLRIVVDDADPGLRQGMPVTVRIHLR